MKGGKRETINSPFAYNIKFLLVQPNKYDQVRALAFFGDRTFVRRGACYTLDDIIRDLAR